MPSVESCFPITVMKQPRELLDVKIKYGIQGGELMAYCLNGCDVGSLSIIPGEAECVGQFCNKQRVIKVWQYDQGCLWYLYDSMGINMVINHALNICHHNIHDVMHIEKTLICIYNTIFLRHIFLLFFLFKI